MRRKTVVWCVCAISEGMVRIGFGFRYTCVKSFGPFLIQYLGVGQASR